MSHNLPIILVSACDKIAATRIISELIDNDLEDGTSKETGLRVWQLVNKYYTAQVNLQAVVDGDEVPNVEAEAHVIYIAKNESADLAMARCERAASALCRGAVRLALVDAELTSDGLLAWGLQARYEVVPMRGAECAGEGEAEGEWGAGRARAALHAHVWPGLRRRAARRPPHPLRLRSPPADDEESSDGGGEEDEEESAVERAEAFVDALGALSALAEPLAEHDELRRERAEQLVAAFCRALGHDLDAC